jgi:hypothetical protein
MSPPEKETGPCAGPATHHATPTSTRIAKPAETGKGFVALVCMGKVRPTCREPEVSWYR